MENLMKITNAQLSRGVYIEYISKDNVLKGSNIKLEFKDNIYYFEVTDISIKGENLEVKAKEVGYYAKKLDRKSNFDLRELIGLDLSRVDDNKTISEIREMSCWC